MTDTIILQNNALLENEIFDAYDITYNDEILIKVTGDNVVIRKCKFDNFKNDMHVLILIEGKNCLIENCTFNQIEGQFDTIVCNKEKLVIKNCLFFNIKNNPTILLLNGGFASIVNNRFENLINLGNIICVLKSKNIVMKNTFINCHANIRIYGAYNILTHNNIDGKNNKECRGIFIDGYYNSIIYNRITNIINTDNSVIVLSNKTKQCSITNNEFSKCLHIFTCNSSTDNIIECNNFTEIINIFTTTNTTKIRNVLCKNNYMQSCKMGNCGKLESGIVYSHTMVWDRPILDKFTNCIDYNEYLLTYADTKEDSPVPEEKEEVKPEVESNTYENNVLHNIMKHFELETKMKRFLIIKKLMDKNQKEMKQLLNEMQHIFRK